MLFKLLQPENAYSPILVTLSGKVILSNRLQLLNAKHSIFVRLSGKVILSKSQKANGLYSISILPILVTCFPSIVGGITISLSFPK